jgi:hypothetical protein
MVATARYSVSQPSAAEVVAVIQQTKPEAEVVGPVAVELAGGFPILEGKPGARAHQVKAMLEVRGLDQMQDHSMVVVVEAQVQQGYQVELVEELVALEPIVLLLEHLYVMPVEEVEASIVEVLVVPVVMAEVVQEPLVDQLLIPMEQTTPVEVEVAVAVQHHFHLGKVVVLV